MTRNGSHSTERGLTVKPEPLSAGAIHLWHIDLERSEGALRDLSLTLSAEETGQAKTFRFARHRRRFIVRRGYQRHILSAYLNMAATDLRYDLNEFGKPEIASVAGTRRIHFSMSHSGDRAVLACSRSGILGVDIEQIREIPDADQIVSRFFSDTEKAEYAQLPLMEQQQAFFDLWTRNEAIVKGLGQGLSIDLTSFSVSLSPAAPALTHWPPNDPKWMGWYLFPISTAADYAGTLATKILNPEISEYQV